MYIQVLGRLFYHLNSSLGNYKKLYASELLVWHYVGAHWFGFIPITLD